MITAMAINIHEEQRFPLHFDPRYTSVVVVVVINRTKALDE